MGAQSVGGPFAGNNLDLQAQFGFSGAVSHHSVQFNSTIMARYRYWDQLLSTFGITTIKPQ